jgi:hypothetical protein
MAAQDLPDEDPASVQLPNARTQIAQGMAQQTPSKNSPGLDPATIATLGRVGAGAQAGMNAGALVGGLIQHGPTKRQNLDVSGNDALSYFKGSK